MSDLTEEDLQIIISRAVDPNARVVSHKEEPFSKSQHGMMGTHILLTIDFENQSKLATLTFFLKKPAKGNISETFSAEKYIFESEEYFFKELHPLLLQHYNGPKWSAECYLVKAGVLVFEDLRAKGYTMLSGSDINLNTVETLIATLARFHASSVLAEAKLGKSLLKEYQDILKEKLYDKDSPFWKFCEVSYETMTSMAEIFGLNPMNVPKIFDRVYEMVQAKEGFVNVMCHGDLWSNNLLINANENPHCILIDFQVIKYASFACDLTMIIYLNTTPEYRKKSTVDMFKSYYTVFRDVLEKNVIQVNIPSYERMYEEYEKYKLVGMSYASIYLPGTCLNFEDKASISLDPDDFKKWMFGNRIEIIKPYLESNVNYANSMKDILNEILEYANEIFC